MQTQELLKIRRLASAIVKKYGAKRPSLFGSFARGEGGADSDVDILVDLPKDKTLLDLLRLKDELELALDRDVDVLTYRALSPLLKKNVRRDMVPL